MTETKFYANIADITKVPEKILKLVMSDWFDKNDTIIEKAKIDNVYIRIIGNDTDQIKARADVLKMKIRNGGGVRIKEIKR